MKDVEFDRTEILRSELEKELRNSYPNLFFNRFEWIGDPDAHLVIDDLSFRLTDQRTKQAVSEFADACQNRPGSFSIYQLPDLTRALATVSLPLLENSPDSTLVIYPGDGADSTRSTFPRGILDQFPSVSVEARRIKDSEGNVIGVNTPNVAEDISEIVARLKTIERVIVVDDVIDSGRTLLAIKNASGLKKLPWYAIAPIVFSPLPYPDRIPFRSSIEGFETICAGIVLQGEKNPTDLNDLSSFIMGGEKTQRLLTKCLNRFVTPQTIIPFFRSVATLSQVVER